MNEEPIQFEYNQKVNSSGIWFAGCFVYAQFQLKRSMIMLDRTLSLVRKVVNFICFFFAALGWLALAWYFYEQQEVIFNYPVRLITPEYYQHPLILVFLLTLVFDLFLYYRTSVSAAEKIKIDYYKLRVDKESGQFKKKTSWNIANTLDEEAKNVLDEAFILASKLKQEEVNPRHLFRALLKSKKIQALFIRLGVDANLLVETLDKHLADDENSAKAPKISSSLKELIVLAGLEAYKRKQVATTVLDLAWPCYSHDSILAEILYDLEVDESKLQNVIEWFKVNEELIKNYKDYHKAALFKPWGAMNRSYTAVATPTLDHFSSDLTSAARSGRLDLCMDRVKEFSAIFDAYSSGQSGVLLIGPTGVGKRSIIEGLAQMMVKEEVPEYLQDKRLLELDLANLISGASASEAQERLLICLNEINRAGNIILYISNIEKLMGISSGGAESFELIGVLIDAISRQYLFCIATATTENYSKFIEGTALGESMTTIGVAEPSFNQTIQILESKASALEAHYGIYLTYSALEKTVLLSNKYLRDVSSPLKAINLLQKAVIISNKAARNNPDRVICSGEEVAIAIEQITGIPANKVSEDEGKKLLNLEVDIHERMVGQEEAVKAVSAALRRARAELKDGARPIASFLFLGPTGVGKTELAKTVSEVYFGDENYMVRLDMSEYQEASSVNKIIGDASGAVGYLTEAVRKKPFSLILLDEIEKAHPDILNLFLQLLDDGRLTDGQGRTISFTQSIIIATSNIGSVTIQESMKNGLSVDAIKQDLIDNQLNKYMRPELINRFDGIVVFKPLTEDNIIVIATLMLKKIKKNLADKGVDFQADKDGVAILAKAGYDPKFGARPLRRLLQERVEDEIANLFLAGSLKRRDTVFIGSNGEIGVEKGREL
jgi:ATPases with chaperone activity, ATP-binding subunit